LPRATRPDEALQTFLDAARSTCLQIAGATECHVAGVEVLELVDSNDATGQYRADRRIIQIDRLAVAEPLARLFVGDTAGLDLEEVIEAAATINHEHIHALGPSDPGPANGYGLIWRGLKARNSGPLNWEEGVTEAWSMSSFGEFIASSGLAKAEPRLLEMPYPNSYEFEVIAVNQVAIVLATLAGRTQMDIVRAMAAELPDTRSALIADLVLAGQGLSEHPDNLVMALALERAFDGLFDFIDLAAARGAGQAVTRVQDAIDALRDEYPQS